MNRTNLSITILSLTAAVMLAIHALVPTNAVASVAVKDRDYQLVTARTASGGDALYIHDVRSGQFAVFTYDPVSRSVRARQVRPMSDAFPAPR